MASQSPALPRRAIACPWPSQGDGGAQNAFGLVPMKENVLFAAPPLLATGGIRKMMQMSISATAAFSVRKERKSRMGTLRFIELNNLRVGWCDGKFFTFGRIS